MNDLVKSNPACNSSMFSAEIRIYEWLLLDNETRVDDPSEADFFYIPVFSTCHLTQKRKDAHLDPHKEQRKIIANVLGWLLDHEEYGMYVRRNRASDHILTLTHDFGKCLNFRDFGTGMKLSDGLQEFIPYMKSMIYLQNNGERSYHASCYAPENDILIPPVTSFRESFARNIPDMYIQRRAIFRGTIDWNWFGKLDPKYSRMVRQTLRRLYENGSRDHNFQVRIESEKLRPSAYFNELAHSTYCLCPLGYATWSQRDADSIASGCIPVFIGDATDRPFESFIKYEAFSVLVSEAEAMEPYRLRQILNRISHGEQKKKRKAVRLLQPLFTYKPIQTQDAENMNKLADRSLFVSGQCGTCQLIKLQLTLRKGGKLFHGNHVMRI
mmetsp:Transcript_31839/g.77597  ORF Transcript_31839/g.77597 Transcript_31839/m.77597 type:complete len:383 (-) Transcript_31839:165-1313(-)